MPGAIDAEVAERIHGELRTIASRHMRTQPAGHTLQASALVNEAYLKLFGTDAARAWNDRAHFFRVASAAMRTILVDHARAKATDKRRPPDNRIDLDDVVDSYEARSGGSLIQLEECLERLTARDPRMVQMVELSFFSGLQPEQIAQLLDVSSRTVKRELAIAKAFIHRELTRD